MPRKSKALVLDSWAALAYLGGEASSQAIADLIAGAHEDRTPMYMCTVNAGEVWYVLAREFSEARHSTHGDSISAQKEARTSPGG